ncbi:MAG: AraC family transcriptional regulator [Ignavibacteria bacterium]|nr:AraC family transcriptional regulator [Ignavibacteria bacterium]
MIKDLILPYIRQYCDDSQFDVNAMVAGMNISAGYLREITHRHFSLPPRELIEAVRICNVLELLDTNESLIIISTKCGFGNYRTFRSAFERRMGITASHARDLIRKSDDKEILIKQWCGVLWRG